MQAVIHKVSQAFQSHFKHDPEDLIQAPGRVNLIGEHTDYNDGFVLPCAINYYTLVGASKRTDSSIEVIAVDYDNQIDKFDIEAEICFEPNKDRFWVNYIRGVMSILKSRGYQFGGMNLSISGNVPQGAGLSSSASLEVAVCETVNRLFRLGISKEDVARIAQQAENEFVGCNCGIMDQLISAKGQADHAMLLDCRSLSTRAVLLPESLSILIINSNKKRGLVDSEYNLRREQCEHAAQFFGVSALRDVEMATFLNRHTELPEIVAKRARHVITENQRTLDAAIALEKGDIALLSHLMKQSHLSMQHDFEITVKEIDLIVSLVDSILGEQGGVRMTGGGFGGCVVAILPEALIPAVKAIITKQYEAQTGLVASFYESVAVDGAGSALFKIL